MNYCLQPNLILDYPYTNPNSLHFKKANISPEPLNSTPI